MTALREAVARALYSWYNPGLISPTWDDEYKRYGRELYLTGADQLLSTVFGAIREPTAEWLCRYEYEGHADEKFHLTGCDICQDELWRADKLLEFIKLATEPHYCRCVGPCGCIYNE
jgi:hypothetical protein